MFFKKTFISMLVAGALFNLYADKFDTFKSIENNAFKQGKELDLSGLKNNQETNDFSEKISQIYQDLAPKVEMEKTRIFGAEDEKNLLENMNIRKKANLENFIQKNRIYIFMSESVPKQVWYNYGNYQVKNKLFNASMVLRGCIGGDCRLIKPTADFVQSIMKYDANNEINPNVIIDPMLFRKYKIDRVPCVVFAENVSIQDYNLSEGADGNFKSKEIYKSCGDWDLAYHLREIQKQSNSLELKKILDEIDDPFGVNTITLEK